MWVIVMLGLSKQLFYCAFVPQSHLSESSPECLYRGFDFLPNQLEIADRDKFSVKMDFSFSK